MSAHTWNTFSSFLNALSNACLLVILALTLSAPVQTAQAMPQLTGIEISPSSPTLNIGESLQLTTIGNYDDGTRLIFKQPKQVSTGSNHTCAVATDGTIQCWGGNYVGQLGNGNTSISDSLLPVQVSGITNGVAVAAGNYSTCAVIIDGTVKCWGANGLGQLGNGTTTNSLLPIAVTGISNAVAVSMESNQACALIVNGTVKCWGYNGLGELGNGTTSPTLTPTTVSGISNATAVSVGERGGCALLVTGEVRCWGGNYSGELGDGTTTSSTTPVTVSGISNATAVSAGGKGACALLPDGTIQCWGDNHYGQLGNGTQTTSTIPVAVSNISNATSVSVGKSHSCAVLADGAIKCWGYNELGQLGNGNITFATLTPATVNGISNAVAVAAGDKHTCVLQADRGMKCWGQNYAGQAGTGVGNYANVPTPVIGISNATTISSFSSNSCAALADGTVKCWGADFYPIIIEAGPGQNKNPAIPAPIADITGASNSSVGLTHSCAVLANGTVKCWGGNAVGQLGNGTTISSITPVSVSNISNAIDISAGGYVWYGSPEERGSTCALLADGKVMCWGSLDFANGVGINSAIPVAVNGINNAVAISVGSMHRCALLSDGRVMCWGANNYGELGDGTLTDSPTPVVVSGISNAIAISAGINITCAVLADGTVKCWGNGRLINGGGNANIVTPTPINGISNARAISVGGRVIGHICAVLATGTVHCWGDNASGQLGNGTIIGSTTPVAVLGISNAVALSAGDAHTCAKLADGTLSCWGLGVSGQLGNGYSHYYTTPAQVQAYGAMAWTSSNPNIATVSPDGLVLAAGGGTALIAASSGGLNATASVTVGSYVDLSINLTSTPASVLQGQAITYNVSVTNNSALAATGVTATGTLPSCTIGNLAPGATASCTSTAIATSTGILTQAMTVSGNETDPNLANNSKSVDTTVVSGADMAVNMTDAPDPVRKGTKLSYTIKVSNSGPLSANNVIIKDTLPPNVTFVSATATVGKCSGRSTVSCYLGKMNNGGSATIKIVVKPQTVGTLTNSVSISANESDYNTSNNQMGLSTSVIR